MHLSQLSILIKKYHDQSNLFILNNYICKIIGTDEKLGASVKQFLNTPLLEYRFFRILVLEIHFESCYSRTETELNVFSKVHTKILFLIHEKRRDDFIFNYFQKITYFYYFDSNESNIYEWYCWESIILISYTIVIYDIINTKELASNT